MIMINDDEAGEVTNLLSHASDDVTIKAYSISSGQSCPVILIKPIDRQRILS